MGNFTEYINELINETIRFSFWDFLIRVIALTTFVFGFLQVLREVPWNTETILGLVLIFTGLLLAVFLYYKHLRRVIYPSRYKNFPISVLDSQAELKILDSKGGRAEYKKTKQCLVLIDGLTRYTETHLSGDGGVEDIHVGEGNRCSIYALPDGRHAVDVVFNKPLRKGETYQFSLSCIYLNSFAKDSEFFSLHVVFPTKKYTLTVEFPAERPVKKAWLEERLPIGTQTIITDPKFISIDKGSKTGRTKIISQLYNLEVGSRQTVHWIW